MLQHLTLKTPLAGTDVAAWKNVLLYNILVLSTGIVSFMSHLLFTANYSTTHSLGYCYDLMSIPYVSSLVQSYFITFL